MGFEDRRIEYRTRIDIGTRPFIGSLERDHRDLEYHLFNISRRGLQILVSLGNGQEPLERGEMIALHLAFSSDGRYADRGGIIWTEHDRQRGLLCCGVDLALEEGSPGPGQEAKARARYLISLSPDTSDIVIETRAFDCASDLLSHLVEHSATIKGRLADALDALSASLKPTGCSGEDLSSLVDGLKAKAGEESVRLRTLLGRMRTGLASGAQAGGFDLADLGNLMMSRAYVPLARAVPPEGPGRQFLEGIGALEEQLLINHNTLVLLWFGYLAYLYQHPEDPNQ